MFKENFNPTIIGSPEDFKQKQKMEKRKWMNRI